MTWPFLFDCFHLVLVALAGGIAIRWWYRGLLPKGSDLPLCAACGYAVVGRTSPTCPECGRDVRTCGVIPPGRRRKWWGAWAALWTLVVTIAATALSPLIPTAYVPESEARVTAEVELTGGRGDRRELRMQAEGHGFVRISELRPRTIAWRMGGAQLHLNPTTGQGQLVTATETRGWQTITQLLAEDFLAAGGMSRTDPLFTTAADDIVTLSPRAVATPIQKLPELLELLRNRGTRGTTSSNSSRQHAFFQTTVIGALVVWLLGIRRILRLRPHPIRGEAAARYLEGNPV